MEARINFIEREMKVIQQFPVIGIHQMAINYWAVAEICRQGIQDNEKVLAELLTENPVTESEFEEFQDILNTITSHIVFCEKTLYDVKIALNDIAWALN